MKQNDPIQEARSLKSKQSVLDFSPKGYLIGYPFLVDLCLKRFIDDFQDDFKQLKNGTFKFKKIISQAALKELLSRYLDETISSVLSKAHQGLPPFKNEWCIIADSGSDRRASYEMVEKDIDISLKRFETIFNSLFNRSMKQSQRDAHTIYCKHRLLLSDDWERICRKKIFGTSNLTVLTARKHKVINETTSDEKIRSLSKNEQDLIVKEATDWVLNHINSKA